MTRYGLILLLLAVASGCATVSKTTTAEKPAEKPAEAPVAAEPPATALKQFVVNTPDPSWKVVPNARFAGAPPAMLALVCAEKKALFKFDAVAVTEVTPSMMALNASDKLAEQGMKVSNVDFSDPTGKRAFFTVAFSEDGEDKRGKVAFLRLEGEDKVTFIGIGLWPAGADEEMIKLFDAVIASARVK